MQLDIMLLLIDSCCRSTHIHTSMPPPRFHTHAEALDALRAGDSSTQQRVPRLTVIAFVDRWAPAAAVAVLPLLLVLAKLTLNTGQRLRESEGNQLDTYLLLESHPGVKAKLAKAADDGRATRKRAKESRENKSRKPAQARTRGRRS